MVQRFGDGLGLDADLLAAADVAVEQALRPLGGRPPDLVAVFACAAGADDAAGVGERVAASCPGAAVVGCTAGGVVAGGRGIDGGSAVAVWAAVLPGVRVRTFHLEVMTGGATAAVVGLPPPDKAHVPDADEVAVLLADPYTFPADGFVTRANAAVPGLPVVGGLASGSGGAGATRLWVDGRTVDRGAVGVLVSGAGARVVVSQGCRAVGPEMTVTAAAGNVVRELAGQPALEKLEQVVTGLAPQDQALASAGLQLGLATDEYGEETEYVLRAVLGAERETGGIVVGDLVEVGRTVRLHVRDADAADADLRARLARYRAQTRDAPAGGALLFTCNGRGRQLFGASHGGADHDARLVRDELGAQGVAGFFAAGELGPVGGRNQLQGFTASLLAFPG